MSNYSHLHSFNSAPLSAYHQSAMTGNWNSTAPYTQGTYHNTNYYGPSLSRAYPVPTAASYYGSASLNNLSVPFSNHHFGSNYNMQASAPLANYHTTVSIANLQPASTLPLSNYHTSASYANLQPSSSAQFSNYRPSTSAVNLQHPTFTPAPLSSYRTSASAANLSTGFGKSYTGQVPLNRDPNPIVIHKRSNPVNYRQQVGVRFIKPEPLPPHGDILVKQLPDTQVPPAPPVYMRNNPPAPLEQAPQIIREQPPVPPPQLPDQIYTIPGRRIQAPRKVIIESYAEVPIARTECRVVYDTPCLLVHPNEAVCF